ncbi:MAG: hypothetical protein R3C70_07130 [Geminicoccaceae bacterium]
MTENTNALAGLRCPNCGQNEAFQIEIMKWVSMTDQGHEDDFGDTFWDSDSRCFCDECGYGTDGNSPRVKDFREAS